MRVQLEIGARTSIADADSFVSAAEHLCFVSLGAAEFLTVAMLVVFAEVAVVALVAARWLPDSAKPTDAEVGKFQLYLDNLVAETLCLQDLAPWQQQERILSKRRAFE